MACAETPLLMEEGEDEMEQAKAWKALQSIEISVDLAGAARCLLGLLTRVDCCSDLLYRGDALRNAIRRYEQLWLPLAAELSDEEVSRLLPPLDVRWVWLLHRLNPEQYLDDCESVCGRPIDASFFDPLSDDSAGLEAMAEAKCREMWSSRFPNEPFEIVPPSAAEARPGSSNSSLLDAVGASNGGDPPKASVADAAAAAAAAAVGGRGGSDAEGRAAPAEGSKELAGGGHVGEKEGERTADSAAASPAGNGSVAPAAGSIPSVEVKRVKYDLEAAAQRQSTFYFQVARSGMLEESFLRGSLQRYRMFLNLIRLNDGAFCIPTYDIDLLWHAHQMCPLAYHRDTIEIFGRLLGHDDSDADAAAEKDEARGSKRLEWGYRSTAQLWDKTYGSAYDRAGAMRRQVWTDTVPAMPAVAPLSAVKARVAVGAKEMAEMNASHGLKQRMVFEAHLLVWEVVGLKPAPPNGENMFVTIQAIQKAPDFSRRTFNSKHAIGWLPPAWRHRWVLEAEMATEGVVFELQGESGGFWNNLWGPRCIGRGRLEWREVLQTPALILDKLIPLNNLIADLTSAPGDIPPRLRVSVSATPPSPGPYLLRSFFMRGSDDNAAMVSEEFLVRQNFKPQMGRWVSRTVVDHRDKEVFVVRRRVASGSWHAGTRPKPVPLKDRVTVVHKGGWTYVRTDEAMASPDVLAPHQRVGIARGPVIAQAVPQHTENPEIVQRFSLIGCSPGGHVGTLTVKRQPGKLMFMNGLELELTDDSDIPARLLPGRRLQYSAGVNPNDELGFVTLIRYPPDAPKGKATALLNWKGSVMEVAAEESAVLVLLICISISEAISEMVMINRVRRFRRVFLPFPEEDTHWGAITASSEKAQDVALETRRAQQDFEFCRIEVDRVKWWNRKPLKWSIGAGNCGAGACGPSITDLPSDMFLK